VVGSGTRSRGEGRRAVRENDLVRYSRLPMPPKLHQQMEARWHSNLAWLAADRRPGA
jgi:hypothetical protein